MAAIKKKLGRCFDKKHQVVMFASTAVALYGYDQGMMSLINTNQHYLYTMGIVEESAWVGTIVSIYYVGTAIGAILAAVYADKKGRKLSIFICELIACVGNLMMAAAGLGFTTGAKSMMLAGRFVMGIGVGGLDAVIPVYSSELSEDDSRGRALAQEFQANIFGLLMAFALNLALTHTLGKSSETAWRVPIIAMQIYPVILSAMIGTLPESPRWLLGTDQKGEAEKSLKMIYNDNEAQSKMEVLTKAQEDDSQHRITYTDMFSTSHPQFHPTILTIMGQVNQALTGYGAISVYGPQIFELLGFSVRESEYLTLGNYIFYFLTMTISWLTIDRLGRRPMMVSGAFGLSLCFVLLTILGGLTSHTPWRAHKRMLTEGIIGTVVLYLATATFGIAWLAQVWLIPTEIYPSNARAQGAAISVVVWGIANFAVTFLTPLGFNGLKYWLFLCFAATNAFAGWWTWVYSPETGGRPFEENMEFFEKAGKEGTWSVLRVDRGSFRGMPEGEGEGDEETRPLLRRIMDGSDDEE